MVYAVFGQFRPYFGFWEDLKVAIGARYNFSEKANSFVWNVSSKIPIMNNDRLYIRANVGTTFKLPNAEQLFVNQPGSYMGNPNLKSQKSFGYNVGLVSNTTYFDFDLTAFYDRITDRIDRVDGVNFDNIDGHVTISGFSVTGTVRPIDGLSVFASLTKQYYDDGVNKKTIYLPLIFAKLGLQWDGEISGYKYGIGIFGSWLGDTYYRGSYRDLSGTSDWKNIGNFWVTDFSLYVKPHEKFRVSLNLSNIFNVRDTAYGYATLNDANSPHNTYFYEAPVGQPFAATLTVAYNF
jgi:vitamin B12 transporter